MAGSQAIHQIEYRWQQAKDMSPVASSMSPASHRSWVQRIGPWVRHPGVDAPTGSVRYERFGDKSAALAWRQRDRQAVGSGDGRPLVSRVLIGPADLLGPEVAMAVCYAGLPPELIGPPPGAVTPGGQLPVVDASWLAKLVHDNTEALDRAAARETGLERLAAAALGDLDMPLAVELSERFINRPPWGGSQAVLLWGLWTTVSLLLGPGVRRGWSFSTFELPLSDMDPATLPDIVFRLSQPASQSAPMTPRAEIRVRPQEPVAMPVETLPQRLARLLVVAYQEHGGEELTQMITSCVDDHHPTDQRIRAVYAALEATLSPMTLASDGPENVTVRRPADRAAPPAPQPAAPASPAGRGQPSDRTAPQGPLRSPPQAGPRHASPSPPAVSPPVTRPAASSSRPLRDASPSYPGGGWPGQAEETRQPDTLSAVLERLSVGPAAGEFESALRALRARNFHGGPPERAAARRLLADHGWYLDVVKQCDQAEREAILMVIFLCSVIPDLGDTQVLAEITYWAGTLAAPDPVINALYQATDGMVSAQPLMSQALEPALAQRWRDEHGIRVPEAIPLRGHGAAPGPRDQGTGPQRVAGPQEPPSAAVPPAPSPTTVPQAGAPPTAVPWTPPRTSSELLRLLEGKWNVPVPLILALCLAVVVLLVVR
jgi:hypothetical protein